MICSCYSLFLFYDLSQHRHQLLTDKHCRNNNKHWPYISNTLAQRHLRSSDSTCNHGQAHWNGIGKIHRPHVAEQNSCSQVASKIQCLGIGCGSNKIKSYPDKAKQQERSCAWAKKTIVKAKSQRKQHAKHQLHVFLPILLSL